jgi:hypothetical protein
MLLSRQGAGRLGCGADRRRGVVSATVRLSAPTKFWTPPSPCLQVPPVFLFLILSLGGRAFLCRLAPQRVGRPRATGDPREERKRGDGSAGRAQRARSCGGSIQNRRPTTPVLILHLILSLRPAGSKSEGGEREGSGVERSRAVLSRRSRVCVKGGSWSFDRTHTLPALALRSGTERTGRTKTERALLLAAWSDLLLTWLLIWLLTLLTLRCSSAAPAFLIWFLPQLCGSFTVCGDLARLLTWLFQERTLQERTLVISQLST